MTSPLEVDLKGNELLAFQPGRESDLEHLDSGIPLPLALVVGRHRGDIPLVYNSWREEWELPGGMIDPGEMPHAAAVREFVEETGQPPPQAQYVGVVTFRLMPDRRLEYAAVYTAELTLRAPFLSNDEIDAIRWWDGTDATDVSQLDAVIARLVIDSSGDSPPEV